MEASARIRERRDALGWSQAKLAERIDTSIEYVSMLERGVRLPSLPTLVAVGEPLALSLDTLVAERVVAVHEPDVLEAAARGVPAALRPLIARVRVAVAAAAVAVASIDDARAYVAAVEKHLAQPTT